jgi:hypothetical protein
MNRLRKLALLSSFPFLAALSSSAQSSQQALQYAAQSISALTGGTAVSDITLTGTATRTVGTSVGTGSATFYAKGEYESRIDMVLSSGNRSEIINTSNPSNGPEGEWIDANGNANPYSPFNCMTDPVWFYDALSSLALTNNSNQVLSYIGLENLNGESVEHLNSIWNGSTLTSMDFYLDATTFLPAAANLNIHPDSDATTNIPVQVLFSNYQSVNGILVPFHIQELLSGTVLLDFTTTSAVINSGLSDSLFTIQ